MSKTSKNKQGELGKLVDVQQASPQTETTRAKQLEPFHWKPGQSGNPKGRPKGSRHKLSEDFLKALSDDFSQNGTRVIAQVRQEDPAKYLTIVAQVVPKENELNIKGDDAFMKIWQAVASGAMAAMIEQGEDGEAIH